MSKFKEKLTSRIAIINFAANTKSTIIEKRYQRETITDRYKEE